MQISYSGINILRNVPLAMALIAICSSSVEARKLSDSKADQSYSIVDVQSVSVNNPQASIRSGTVAKSDYTVDCDLLVVGAGAGGVAAALRATAEDWKGKNIKVCLTEETDWIGGQLTAQGVSALDENFMVEGSGACRSYQNLRTAIRSHYKEKYKLKPDARDIEMLNPGDCWVSWLSFEPKVALEELNQLLQPAVDSGRLAIYTRLKPVYARLKSGQTVCAGQPSNGSGAQSNEIEAVGMLALDGSNKIYEFRPKLCLDATELGDMLPLANLPYSSGSDSRETTGEPHAPLQGDPQNVQDFTYPFVVELKENERHLIAKPAEYDDFNGRGKFSFQGYKMFEQASKRPAGGDHADAAGKHGFYLPFWTYRRLLSKELFQDERVLNDLAMINWDSNDLRGENIIDQSAEVQAGRLALGKLCSLGFLYWLQTEAPRDDGGKGYAELELRPDVLGTEDGLSKYPYIRESRRAHCHTTIVEQDIVAATNSGARARQCNDSVGIGLYPVDIHGRQEIPGAGQAARPFQIPLSALQPRQQTNLFPACKNIGTTHITNGAYRLHPIEWAIGEAQGAVCRMMLNGMLNRKTLFEADSLRRIQLALLEAGVPVYWYDDVATGHENFAAIQFLAISGAMLGDCETLHFRPDDPITRGEAAQVLARLLPGGSSVFEGDADSQLKWCIHKGILSEDEGNGLQVESPLSGADCKNLSRHIEGFPPQRSTMTRSEFAGGIFGLSKKHL